MENSPRILSKEIYRSSATIKEPADYFWAEYKSRHSKVVVSLLPPPPLTIENKDRTRNGRGEKKTGSGETGREGQR